MEAQFIALFSTTFLNIQPYLSNLPYWKKSQIININMSYKLIN